MYTICNHNYIPYIAARFQNGHLSIFWGQNYWKTGELKKKREAVRSPKSQEVFYSCRENHMYVGDIVTCICSHSREGKTPVL